MDQPDETIQACLRSINQIWRMDEAACRRTYDGFDWWPGRHKVMVRVRSNDKQGDEKRYRVTCETDFLKEVEVNSDKFIETSGPIARFTAPTYAWVYETGNFDDSADHGVNGDLHLFSSAYFNDSTLPWVPHFFAQAAIVQPVNAELQSAKFAELLGSGAPNMSGIDGIVRDVSDKVLTVGNAVFAPAGKADCRWKGSDEFAGFVDQFCRSEYCAGNGDPDGLTFEASFGAETALARFFTNQAHPQLGNGLLATLQLPRVYEGSLEATQECATLNLMEAINWTDFPQMGCWHPEPQGDQTRVVHSAFVPNALFREGLVANIGLWAMMRARWVRTHRYPNLEDLPVGQIFERRSGT